MSLDLSLTSCVLCSSRLLAFNALQGNTGNENDGTGNTGNQNKASLPVWHGMELCQLAAELHAFLSTLPHAVCAPPELRSIPQCCRARATPVGPSSRLMGTAASAAHPATCCLPVLLGLFVQGAADSRGWLHACLR